MRIRQYTYFAIKSSTLTAAEMSARIGLTPDEVMTQGSRSLHPLRPAMHAWKIACHDPGLTVDEMIRRIIDRLEPFVEPIGELTDELNHDHNGSSTVLQVVRHFND